MSTPLGSDIEARVNQVLKDFLPAELDLVDIEKGGTATPDVAAGDHLVGPMPVSENSPSIVVTLLTYEVFENRPVPYAAPRLGYDAHITVEARVQHQSESEDRMRDLAQRYHAGIVRVLLLRKANLETTADPTTFAESVNPDGRSTIVDVEQSSGAQVRTCTIPIVVRMRENL